MYIFHSFVSTVNHNSFFLGLPETYLAETANDKFYPRIQCALPCDHDVRGYPCYECDCLEHDHEFEMEYKHDPENCGCKPENTQKRNSGIDLASN